MFYDALGSLVGQAGLALGERDERGAQDARDERELRQIGLLLRRARGVWPLLFETLDAESRILECALDELDRAFEAQGLPPVDRSEQTAPLDRYRDLELAIDRAFQQSLERASDREFEITVAIDRALERLLERANEEWSTTARRALRARLAEAAQIQGQLTDAMLAIR